jgi:hypothetical protein
MIDLEGSTGNGIGFRCDDMTVYLGVCVLAVGDISRSELSGDEGEAFDGDFGAGMGALGSWQEDDGDFVKSMDGCWPWDGESQYLLYRWTVQRNLSRLAGYDCSLWKVQGWLSDGA